MSLFRRRFKRRFGRRFQRRSMWRSRRFGLRRRRVFGRFSRYRYRHFSRYAKKPLRLHGEVLKHVTEPVSLNFTVNQNNFQYTNILFNDQIVGGPVYQSTASDVQGIRIKVIKLGLNLDVRLGTFSAGVGFIPQITYRVVCWRIPRRAGPYNATYSDVIPVLTGAPVSTFAANHLFVIPSTWTNVPTNVQYNPNGIGYYQIVFDKTYTLSYTRPIGRHRYRFGKNSVIRYVSDNQDPPAVSQEIADNLYGITIMEFSNLEQFEQQTAKANNNYQKIYRWVDN